MSSIVDRQGAVDEFLKIRMSGYACMMEPGSFVLVEWIEMFLYLWHEWKTRLVALVSRAWTCTLILVLSCRCCTMGCKYWSGLLALLYYWTLAHTLLMLVD